MTEIESGADRGVIFPSSGPGIPWYGLVRVEEIVNTAEAESYFLDGVPVRQKTPVDDFSALVETFTYPVVLDNQGFVFGFTYRTKVGLEGDYQIHIVYNASVDVPDERLVTEARVVDPTNFIFVLKTTPVKVRKTRPFSHVVISSNEVTYSRLKALEDMLYGTASTSSTLPEPEWLVELFGNWTFGYGHGPYGHGPYGGNT